MKQTRETVRSRFGFLMLAAGCAIGLGNVWRFPYVTGEHGGAVFVLLYLICLVLMGFPIMVMELAVGRASGRGLYGAFRDLPEKHPSVWRHPAAVLFCGNLLLMMMYTTVSGWMIAYCTDFITGAMAHLQSQKAISGHFTELLASPGKMTLYMTAATFIGSLVCAGGLRSGVERVTKILMTGLFLLLACLCIYSLTLPGAKEGMTFYLMPDWSRLAGKNLFPTISAVMGQAFFTLSLGIGSIAIFGSYTGKKHSLASETAPIILCDTLVAILSGIVIFSACFTYHIQAESGPGLVLISLTGIFQHLPAGRFWGILFFLFLSIAAMTTVIAVFENLIALMMDEWHFSRKKAAWGNFTAVTLLSLPCVFGYNLLSRIHPFGGNSTILDLEDYLVSNLFLPIGSLAILFFCCWKHGWGWRNFLTEANSGKGLRFPAWSRIYIFFILPLLIFALFLIGVYDRSFR